MSDALSRTAVRTLQREAQRLIAVEGVLNENAVLTTVTALIERMTGRPHVRFKGPGQWTEFCRGIEVSYTLGLVVGSHLSDLRFVGIERRRPRRKKAR